VVFARDCRNQRSGIYKPRKKAEEEKKGTNYTLEKLKGYKIYTIQPPLQTVFFAI